MSMFGGSENVYAADSQAWSKPDEAVFISKVYMWMTMALALTGVVALLVSNSETMVRTIFGNPLLFFGLVIGELVLVVGISAGIGRLSPATAIFLFLLYAGVNGLTLSIIFLVYTTASIGSTFLVTAGTFGIMSVYGYTTKRDLTQWGSLLFMGLIGIIIASVVNIFLHSETLYWIVTYAGILIFVGLTAYDTQKIKQIGRSVNAQGAEARKYAILGALKLYLDFINLFILLLRVMGRRR